MSFHYSLLQKVKKVATQCNFFQQLTSELCGEWEGEERKAKSESYLVLLKSFEDEVIRASSIKHLSAGDPGRELHWLWIKGIVSIGLNEGEKFLSRAMSRRPCFSSFRELWGSSALRTIKSLSKEKNKPWES